MNFEEAEKSMEDMSKQVGLVAKHFGLTDKDQSAINVHKDQIGNVFSDHKTSDAQLKALDQQAARVKDDPKALACYVVAFQQHIAEKQQKHDAVKSQVDESLKVPPQVG